MYIEQDPVPVIEGFGQPPGPPPARAVSTVPAGTTLNVRTGSRVDYRGKWRIQLTAPVAVVTTGPVNLVTTRSGVFVDGMALAVTRGVLEGWPTAARGLPSISGRIRLPAGSPVMLIPATVVMTPGLSGFGAAAGEADKRPFYAREDPPREFVKAIQQFVSMPVSGIWDQSTHDAVSAAMAVRYGGRGLPAWGTDPAGTAARVGTAFLDLPTLSSASPTATLNVESIRLLDLLGLPSTSVEDLVAHVEANRAAIEVAQADTVAYIRTAETTAGTTTSSVQTASYLIGGLVISAAVVVGLVVASRGRR